MFRDSKLGRDSLDDPEFDYCSPQIELLSDFMIDKITSLYGYTIKANTDCSLLELRNLLLAIVYHLSATDNNCSEMHQFCPGGESSWCNFQKAIALRTPMPSHPRALSEGCRDRILAILGPYITVEFLRR